MSVVFGQRVFGPLSIDVAGRQVDLEGEPVTLTRNELDILGALSSRDRYASVTRRRRNRPAAQAQLKRTFIVARPKIFRPSDFAATMTTPLRVVGSNDLIRPLNSMSAPSLADTIAGADSRTA